MSEYDSLNKELQEKLTAEFKPLGIVAYTNCCRLGCTGTYEETDENFKYRDNGGISFFRLHLNGMNYDESPDSVYAHYVDFNYLIENWEEESKIIERWVDIVDPTYMNVEVEKPNSNNQAIKITFAQPLNLEKAPESMTEEDAKQYLTDLLSNTKKRKSF